MVADQLHSCRRSGKTTDVHDKDEYVKGENYPSGEATSNGKVSEDNSRLSLRTVLLFLISATGCTAPYSD